MLQLGTFFILLNIQDITETSISEKLWLGNMLVFMSITWRKTIFTLHIIVTAQQWAQTLKIDKAKIIRFSGLHKEYEYDYQNEDQKEETGEVSNLGEW